MDKFNVIEPTLDLDSLEKEMEKYARLPYKFKLRSDEECIKKYGVTNNKLYNILKSNILNPNSNEIEGILREAGFEFTDDDNYVDIDDSIEYAKELNNDANVALIYPRIRDIELLNTLYTKYMLLPDKYKRFSNSYSIYLFGYNVPNMYEINKSRIEINNIEDKNLSDPNKNILKENNTLEPVLNLIEYSICKNDKNTLNEILINSEDCPLVEKTIIKEEIKKAIDIIDEYSTQSFEEFNMVPWFTPDEEYGKNLSNFEDKDYSSKLVEASRMYKYNNTEENKNKLLELGWNPSVELTKESIEYAKKRQSDYIKEHTCKIIDVSKISTSESIIESSNNMKMLYKKLDLYPVYIVLSFTNTKFGKIIRFLKKSTYTHAGISLDSDLKEILTFKYNSNFNGFSFEDLKTYTDTYDDALIEVLCLFVDKTTLDKLKMSIKYYIENKDKTKYGFKNLFYILFNKKKKVTDYDLQLVCSQFVDHILKLCGIDIIKKPNNLVIPQDYATIAVQHPRVYKLYEGLAKLYNEKKIENIIEILYNNYSDIKYVNESGYEYDLSYILDDRLEPSIITK